MKPPADDDPWRPPRSGPGDWKVHLEGPDCKLDCPECGQAMEPGYLTTGAWLYWREWQDKSLLVRFSDRLPNTLPTFVGINRLPGFRCPACEMIVFRYGSHRQEWNAVEKRTSE